jgi:hypothetical protein
MRHPGDTLTVDTASVGQQKMAHVADRAAPADTIQYLGVLPDVFPQAKVDVPDTLQRIEFTSFVPTGKLKLARFRSAREFAPGIEGTPLFRDPCSSDLLILHSITLFVCCPICSFQDTPLLLSTHSRFLYGSWSLFVFRRTLSRRSVTYNAS